MSPPSRQAVKHPEPEGSPTGSPVPAPQPVNSQESFDLGNVSGGDKQAGIEVNDPDAIHMLKSGAPDVHYFFDKTVTGDKVFCNKCR